MVLFCCFAFAVVVSVVVFFAGVVFCGGSVFVISGVVLFCVVDAVWLMCCYQGPTRTAFRSKMKFRSKTDRLVFV